MATLMQDGLENRLGQGGGPMRPDYDVVAEAAVGNAAKHRDRLQTWKEGHEQKEDPQNMDML